MWLEKFLRLPCWFCMSWEHIVYGRACSSVHLYGYWVCRNIEIFSTVENIELYTFDMPMPCHTIPCHLENALSSLIFMLGYQLESQFNGSLDRQI